MEKEEFKKRIKYFKKILSKNDYKVLKYFEGLLTEKEYGEIKQYREHLREKIRELEAKLNASENN